MERCEECNEILFVESGNEKTNYVSDIEEVTYRCPYCGRKYVWPYDFES